MCVLYDIVMTRKLKFTVLDDPTCCRCVCVQLRIHVRVYTYSSCPITPNAAALSIPSC